MSLINNYISKFLEYEEKTAGLASDTIERYEYLINVYGRFMSKYTDSQLVAELNKATYGHFFDALEYYIINNEIKTEDSCSIFISVLRGFFRFLLLEGLIINDLVRSFDHNLPGALSFTSHYKNFVNTLKKNGKIKLSSKATPLNDKQIIDLLRICDNHFEDFRKGKEQYEDLP